MILPFNTQVWFYRNPVDFRKQIDGLVILVADTLQQDPTSGQLFVFRNRGADKLKILVWEGNGFWLLYKRNETSRFVFPALDDETVSLSVEQLQWLLSGLDCWQLPQKTTLKPRHFF